MQRRLFRSRTDRMVGGVCGGLAVYIGIDSTVVRLLFLLVILGTGWGVLLYLILWLVVPSEERLAAGDTGLKLEAGELSQRAREMGEDLRTSLRSPHPQAGLILGAGLIILGGIILLQNLDLRWLRWLEFDYLWPVLLIVAGIVLLLRRKEG